MANAGRILIMPKGAYDASAIYEMLDLVSYDGGAWIAKRTVTGIAPSEDASEYWQNMVSFKIADKRKRIVKPQVVSSLHLYDELNERDKTEVEIKEYIDAIYKCGYDGVTIYTSVKYSDGKYFLYPSLNTLKTAYDYAIKTGLNIKAIKMHNSDLLKSDISFDVWFEEYKALCRKLFDMKAEYFTILNESVSVITNPIYINAINSFLGEIKEHGYKTGFSGVIYDMNLYSNVDALFMHWYPSLTTKGTDATYNDAITGFKNCQSLSVYEKMRKAYPDKEFVVSETGCQRIWEALAKPEQYLWEGEVHIDKENGTPQAIFLNALFATLQDSEIESVWTWYDDTSVFMPDAIKVYNNWLGGRI